MTPCPNCGTESPSGVKFCPECGAALVAPEAIRDVRKTVTILFADVAGSTALGEELDPETLRSLMDIYFRVMRGIIEAHGGTVEKFIGDAVMAVFGIPVIHEDDALRAVRAAAAIRSDLAALAEEAARSHSLTFRTGINTGEVFARDPTGGQAFVTGDPVNTAARLEQAAGAGEILLGATTYQLVRDAVVVEPIEPLSAKGKAEPLAAYRLVSVDPALAGHSRRLDAPLVGRDRELTRLLAAFTATTEERSCHLFTLLGPAGIGKSRLTAEFTAAVEAEATVVLGRCLSYGEGITYWPIGEIVRSAARIDEADTADAARRKLRTRLEGEPDADAVANRVANAIGLSLDPAPQEEVFWAIRKLFEHLARERPLVIIVEDIHWAEPTLLDLIEYIAIWSHDAPILLLCPARPELLDTRAGWGSGTLGATTILLEPLGADATTRLIGELPGGSAVPASIAERILTAAEGNPLFVEEMLRMLVDDGALVEGADGGWIAATTLAQVRVPASISVLLSARLERLAPDERAVAERASVVGRVFEQAAVAELASDALRPAVSRSLHALVRKELVRPDRSELSAGDAFTFRHILIRDAAYEALPKVERAILHERFADWLERIVGERLAEYEEIVGYHLEQAVRYRSELDETDEAAAALADRAGRHLAAAGGRAFDRGDAATAVTLLGRAAAAFPVGSPERLRLIPDLGFALFSSGRIPDAERLIASAVDEAAAAGEWALGLHAELEGAIVRVLSVGEHSAPRALAEAAIPRLEHAGDELGLARAYLVIASADWIRGRVEDAMAARRRALAHAASVGDIRIEGRSTCWGVECYGPAPAAAALASLEASLDRSVGDPLQRAQASFSLAGVYAMRGRADDSREAYRELIAILDDLGAPVIAGASAEIAGVAELIIGDPAAATERLQEGIDRLEGLGASGYRATLHSIQSIALGRMGRFSEALDVAAKAVTEGSVEDTLLMVTVEHGRSIALLGLGDVAGAVAAGREAVRLAESTDWVSYHADVLMALASALRASADEQGARVAATRARELFHDKEHLPGERRAEAFLAAQASGDEH